MSYSTSPPRPPQDFVPANPRYFGLVPPKNWEILGYISSSADQKRAAHYGLIYLDPDQPHKKITQLHGVNMYRWDCALKNFLEMKDGDQYNAARKLLSQKSRNRRISHNWFSKDFRSGKSTRKEPKTNSGGLVINQSSTTTIHQNTIVNQGIITQNTADPSRSSSSQNPAADHAGPKSKGGYEPPLSPTPELQNEQEEADESSSDETDSHGEGDGNLGAASSQKDDPLGDFEKLPSSSPVPEGLSPAQKRFLGNYSKIPADEKMTFQSTGRVLEDIIRDACLEPGSNISAKTSLLLSYVIVIGDKFFKSLLPQEQEEIKAMFPSLPPPNDIQVASLARFHSVRTTQQLRGVLHTQSYLAPSEPYDPERHWFAWWSDLALRSLLNIYESPNQAMSQAHLEDWFSSHVWSPIIDQCLISIPGITLERKETHCVATSVRKNRERSETGKQNRRKTGAHFDGIIRTTATEHRVEYGVIEAAKSFVGGETSTKFLNDSFKIEKALRDLLTALHIEASHNPEVAPHLQVVAITNAGLHFQLSRMINPKGQICLLERHPIASVPSSLEGGMKNLLHLLVLMPRIREVIMTTMSLVVRGPDRDPTADELMEELKNGIKPVSKKLGWGEDTE